MRKQTSEGFEWQQKAINRVIKLDIPKQQRSKLGHYIWSEGYGVSNGILNNPPLKYDGNIPESNEVQKERLGL